MDSYKSGGIGFLGVLTIVFVVLKIVNVVSWSWLWVLSPLWIPISIVVFVLFVVLIIAIVYN